MLKYVKRIFNMGCDILGIGKTLENLIKIKNRNINELANKINVSPQTIYSIIRRDTTNINLYILQKLANELDVTLDHFINDQYHNKENVKLDENFNIEK